MRSIVLALVVTLLSTNVAMSAPKGEGTTALGVADTSNISVGQAVSLMFGISDDWLQTFATIERTSGVFVFGVGGIYKFTVAGDRRIGFHVGPGISLGTVAMGAGAATSSEFAFSISGMAGAHFTAFDRVMFSIDGGPILAVVDGDANFAMKPMGEHLGVSVHYLF